MNSLNKKDNSIISIRELTIQYQGTRVLNNVGLDLERGSVYGIIGPIDNLPIYFEILSFGMSLRYAIESLQAGMIQGKSIVGISDSIGILLGFNLFILGLSILSIKNNKPI